MISTQYINLDMTPSGVLPVLYCSQYDVGRPLGMVVHNGGEAVDLTAYTCAIEATRTDGTAITAAVTTDGSIGVFTTTATMTNKMDKYPAKMVIVDGGGNRVASLAFVMCVTPATMDENAESIEEDQSLYQQYTETVQSQIATERQQRLFADSTLQNNINSEASARAAGDSNLSAYINAEASARVSADNALQSSISAEATARQTADNALQSQIDELVAPSGEAPSAAEVTNARVGADGTVYTSLGDAIRGQVTDLSDSLDVIDDAVKITKNLVSEIVVGKYVNYNNSGVIIGTDANRAYVKVPVKPGKTYSVSVQFSGNFSFWAYENSGTEYGISKISSFETEYVITAPSNATILYLSNSGWNANTQIVVLECDYSIRGTKLADYPFDTTVKVEIKKQSMLYDTVDIIGIEKYQYFQRGGLTSGTTPPTADNATNYLNQRVRTPVALPMALDSGDTLSINNAENVAYSVYSFDGTYSGWLTTDYVVPSAGNYWVDIRHSDNSNITTIEELSTHFTINRKGSILSKLIGQTGSNDNAIPDYYFDNDYLPNKVDTINGNSGILDGVVFAFLTDPHWNNNTKKSASLLKYIREKTGVDIVLCGGDFVSLIGDASQLQDEYDETLNFISTVGKNSVFSVRGNHDFYNHTSDNSSVTNYTWAQTYNAIYRNSEYRVTNALVQHGAYCIDNDPQKTRFICLNSSDWNLTYDKADQGVPYISVSQAQWFMDALTEKSGYKIIVMSHIPSVSALTTDYESQQIIQDILVAFVSKTNFSTEYKSVTLTHNFGGTTNELIFHLSGHLHRDASSVDNGILSVVTTCDAHYADDGHGAVTGTITEQAFDVFCIDYNLRTISTVRVGRGNNRSWTY